MSNQDFFLLYFFDFATFLVGLTGNFLFYLVCSISKHLKQNPITFYFKSLTISDNLNLLLIPRFYLNDAYKLSESKLMCKLSEYFVIAIASISAWHLVMISLERMAFIIYPNRFKFINKKLFQIIMIASIYLFNLFFYSSAIPYTQYREDYYYNQSVNVTNEIEDQKRCEFSYKMINLRIIQLVLSSIVPFVLMTSFSFITIISIAKSRKRCHTKAVTYKRDLNFAMTSFFLNFLFLFLTFPIILVEILEEFHLKNIANIRTIKRILLVLNNIEYATLFFVNYLCNKIFKNEFLKMIKIKTSRISVEN